MDLASCCTCVKKSKCTSLSCVDELRKEVWRLRLNWLYTTLVCVLINISVTSVTSSFHQFVINPRADSGGSNGTLNQFQFGLGQSESFYSWLLSTFNIGSLVGAMLSGLLVKCIPYWYLFMLSLLTHIVGFLLYAFTYEGWQLIISKFLSGYFLGAHLTLSLSYASESSVEYVDLMRKRKKKIDDGTTERVKGYLFSLVSIGECLGSFIGPGVAAIFAQFEIDQFRSIAWFNVATGTALLILQIIIFRGEISCKRITQCQGICQCIQKPSMVKPKPLQVFLITILLLARLVGSFRLGIYETLLNPVLSDSFGFTEREVSYYLLGFSLTNLFGVLIIFILQKVKASNQIVAFIGISMTVIGCILFADWQAIPYDPCTEYSPFHHPEITQNYSIKQSLNETSKSVYNNSTDDRHLELIKPTAERAQLHFHSDIEMKFTDGSTVKIKLPGDVELTCNHVDDCECHQHSAQAWSVLNSICLFYSQDDGGRIAFTESSLMSESEHYPSKRFQCVTSPTILFQHPLSLCVHLYGTYFHSQTKKSSEKLSMTTGSIQSLQVLSNFSYYTAKMNCIHANFTNHHCHWSPSSVITKKECEDCQPICKSIEQSLTFVQYVLGSTLIFSSLPVTWVPISVMASSQASMELQGIIMGTLIATNSIGWSISPLLLVSSYEAVQKRTFLPMSILIGLHLPFLILIIALYRKLGPDTHSGYSRIESLKNCDHESAEVVERELLHDR